MLVIEAILAGVALYMLILDIKMKREGTIPSFFVNPKIDLEKAPDKQGYIDHMFPRIIIFALILLGFSAFSILGEYMSFPLWCEIVINCGYIGLLVFYTVMTVKAQNNFLIRKSYDDKPGNRISDKTKVNIKNDDK